MPRQYFSDQERGPRPRIEETISDTAWAGLRAAMTSRVADGSFGFRYPQKCPDGNLTYGCDASSLYDAVASRVPDGSWSLRPGDLPSTPAILDAIQFCYGIVAQPTQTGFHGYYAHHHLSFDPESGREMFRSEINEVLARNALLYELTGDGSIIRLGPEVIRDVLLSAAFETGDEGLDALLDTAKTKYLDPDAAVRQEGLEKLWDAWERLKTVEPGSGKRARATALLDRLGAGQEFRDLLEGEAKALTAVGNEFHIRHTEVWKVSLTPAQVDYLFHRMFALIWLILLETDRVA